MKICEFYDICCHASARVWKIKIRTFNYRELLHMLWNWKENRMGLIDSKCAIFARDTSWRASSRKAQSVHIVIDYWSKNYETENLYRCRNKYTHPKNITNRIISAIVPQAGHKNFTLSYFFLRYSRELWSQKIPRLVATNLQTPEKFRIWRYQTSCL